MPLRIPPKPVGNKPSAAHSATNLNYKNNAMKKICCSLRWLLLSAPLLFSPALMADETEIYFADKSGDVAPNVLFLIDVSGSMNMVVPGDPTNRSRLQVLKDSFSEVMNTAPANLNIGLMHYANHSLAVNDPYWWNSIKGVNFPVTLADEKVTPLIAPYKSSDNLPDPASSSTTVRQFLASIVNNWNAEGYTPIVDSLYEASRYFRGDAVGWGLDSPSIAWASHPLTYDGASLNCKASHEVECVNTFGECNGNIVQNSCVTRSYSWVGNEYPDRDKYCSMDSDNFCYADVEICNQKVCDNFTGSAQYKSPIKYACQANYLVLMSDGKPEYPYYKGSENDGTGYYPPSSKRYPGPFGTAADYTAKIKPEIKNKRVEDYIGIANCADAPNGYNSGTCGPELTHWLANTDQSATLSGDQKVETYAVAFAMADEPTGTAYMKSLVTAEDGFFPANSAADLSNAFQSILNSVEKTSSSFSSPTYAVDENTMLANSDDVYIPMFNRDTKPAWPGNLKKFKRKQFTQADGTVVSKIVDKNGSVAVNEKGEFVDGAYDLWGVDASGNDVATGGAASRLPNPADRNLYTDVSASSDLTAAANKLDASNTNITSTMLAGTYITGNSLQDWWNGASDGISCVGSYKDCNGVSHTVLGNPLNNSGCVNIKEVTTCPLSGSSISSDERTALLNFVRGKNPDGTLRQHMGDILNSKPLVVDYGTQQRIFAATNEGYLHSIDAESGQEKWGFMPSSLLDNIKTFFDNKPSEDHVYGIDGPVTLWNYDKNMDGVIKATDGDKRVLYFGLRRGGNVYYALDITSPDNPMILWKKENVVGIDDGPWDTLGETWSKPTLAKMRVGSASSNELKNVLVFGAGYDPAKDNEIPYSSSNNLSRQADTLGRDVMIVDALTGELLWDLQRDLFNNSASSNLVKDSVPGDIRVLDMDRNGALDRLYFADTGGNLWRVDMDHDLRDTDSSMYDYKDAILTKIAALGTDGDYGTDTRKFFYEPDVAMMQYNGKVLMTIALGSGYRTHPLNTNTKDRFYVIMDPNVYNEPPTGPTGFTTINNADLVNARTAIGNTGGFASADDSLLNGNHKGWYYAFDNVGEKVLAPAVSFLNKVVFTTFAPVDENGKSASGDPCEVPPNSARAYVLDLFTGKAVANLDRSTDDSKDDFVVAGVNEILDAAKIVFRMPTAKDGSDCKEGDCKQTVEIRVGKMQLPVMDDSNSDNSNTGSSVEDIAGKTDLSDILPRIFWRDDDVSN